jgi:acyl carrier protein
MDNDSAINNQPHRRRVERRVCALVAANLCLDVRQVSLTSSFEELEADTLDFYSIMMDLEAAFGIPIPDCEARQFATVGDAVAFILARETIFPNHQPRQRSAWRRKDWVGKEGEMSKPASIRMKPLGREEVERQVIEIISAHLCLEARRVSPSSSFQDLLACSLKDLGADSFDLYSIMLDLEEAFGVSLPDREAEKFVTVADAVECILAQARRRPQLTLVRSRPQSKRSA